MSSIHDIYLTRCQQESDINLLLPAIYDVAKHCSHITEFGFRGGNSASALIAGLAENGLDEKIFHTYDLEETPEVEQLKEAALEAGVEFHFHREDTQAANIQLTEFLFIDTEHTYTQVTNELNRHHEKVHSLIGFHDVDTFQDLARGIEDWRRRYTGWDDIVRKTECNGLLIMRRIDTDAWKQGEKS